MQLNVPYLDQSRCAVTGCESVSAVMLLNYLGYPITVEDFIDHHLPCGFFGQRNGELWGVDPREAFVGNPRDSESLGCYAPVIVHAMENLVGDKYQILDETGTEIDALCQRYLDAGMPVLLWTSIDLKPTVNGPWYRLTSTGEPFMWISNEHCLLLVGYDETCYYCNDPWNNRGLVAYPRKEMWERHREQGMQAVALRRRCKE